MARSHRMTPARRAALRKAQAASARKRRGKGKGKLARSNNQYDSFKRTTRNALIAAAAVGGAAAYAGYVSSRSRNRKPKVAAPKQHTIRDAVSQARSRSRRTQAPGLQLASRYRSRARYQGFYRL